MFEAIRDYDKRIEVRRRAIRAAQVASLCLALAGGGVSASGCSERTTADGGMTSTDATVMPDSTVMSDATAMPDATVIPDATMMPDAACDTAELASRLRGSTAADFDCECADVEADWTDDADCCLEKAALSGGVAFWDPASSDRKCAVAVPGPFVPPAMIA